MQTKVCSKCKTEKSVTEFHKSARGLHGVRGDCKVCHGAVVAAIGAKAYAERGEEIRSRNRAWQKKNRQKCNELDRKKRAANPELYKQIDQRKSRAYYARNPNYSIKNNAERLRRWRKRHPERELETQNGRRSKYKGTPAWGNREMIRVVYKKAKELGMEVDHIVPLKHPLVSGLHVWHNLQLLVRNENRRKKNRVWPDMPESP